MSNLLHLEWHRDVEGYVIREDNPPPLPKGTPRTILSDAFQAPSRLVVGASGKTEIYSPFIGNIALFKELADTEQTEAGVLLFATKYGPLQDRPLSVEQWKYAIRGMRQSVALAFADDAQPFLEAWNREADVLARAHLRFAPVGRHGRPTLRLVPRSLHDAAWIQLAHAVAGDQQMLVCEWCSKPFLTGRATGRRETSRFCKDICRKAWHRHQRKGT